MRAFGIMGAIAALAGAGLRAAPVASSGRDIGRRAPTPLPSSGGHKPNNGTTYVQGEKPLSKRAKRRARGKKR